MSTITLELPDELRTLLDEVRGDVPLTEYALNALETQAILERADLPLKLEDVTPGMSAEEHIRLADLTEQPGQSMTPDELIAKVKAHFPDLWPRDTRS